MGFDWDLAFAVEGFDIRAEDLVGSRNADSSLIGSCLRLLYTPIYTDYLNMPC